MSAQQVRLTLVLIGSVLFNLVFWQEKMALNTLFFDGFLCASIFMLYPASRSNPVVLILLGAHVFCLAMVLLLNTPVSKIAVTSTFLLFSAFSCYAHRSPWYAGGSVLTNLVMASANIAEQVNLKAAPALKSAFVRKLLRFAGLPLLLFAAFLFIYTLANPAFSHELSTISTAVTDWISHFFTIISLPRICFFMAGIYLTATLLLKSRFNFFSDRDLSLTDELVRPARFSLRFAGGSQHSGHAAQRSSRNPMALKNEHFRGVMSLVVLNLLLLAVNLTDVKFIWLNFSYSSTGTLKDVVHQGTELLIISILMAMAVVLFFFKGNLNFYKENKYLKIGAYAWIAQNAFLVLSVLLRDYYYITNEGLAYKRIGVLFFLTMVLAGLISVALKIAGKKTSYFLFRVNAWTGIILLVLSTAVSWDRLIAEYNFSHAKPGALDVAFLMTLSDDVLPVLDAHKEVIRQYSVPSKPSDNSDPACDGCYFDRLVERERKFQKDETQYSWLSWNYADARNVAYFKQTSRTTLSQK